MEYVIRRTFVKTKNKCLWKKNIPEEYLAVLLSSGWGRLLLERLHGE